MGKSSFQLHFDGSNLHVFDDATNLIRSFLATSGRRGSTFEHQDIKDYGPIPEGRYTLDPKSFSEGGILRNLTGDWGKWRAPLEPFPGTNTYGRSGFFIHGGDSPGSAGCIDIGHADTELHDLLKDHE